MISKGLFRLPKSVLPLAMTAVIIAGTSIALSSTTAGRGDVGVEFERRVARSRQNMRTGTRWCLLGPRCGR